MDLNIKDLLLEIGSAVINFSCESPALILIQDDRATFLFQTLMGLTRPQQGQITFGKHILTSSTGKQLDIWQKGRLGIRYLPSPRITFPSLTAAQTLKLVAQNNLKHRISLESLYREIPLLSDIRNRRIWQLSGGQQQILSLICCFTAQSRLLMLEEPFVGISLPMQKVISTKLISHLLTTPAIALYYTTQTLPSFLLENLQGIFLHHLRLV